MFIFPFEKITMTTEKSVDVISSYLNRYVEPQKFKYLYFGWLQPSNKPYAGVVNESGFTVTRNTFYHLPSKPLISGKFEKSGRMTKISIKWRVHYAIIVTLVVLGVVALYATIKFRDIWYISIACVFYIILMIFFWLEVSKSKEDISQYLSIE
jgi:uncharacterized membrane protein